MVWPGSDRVVAAMVDIKLITFRMVNKDVNWKWLNHCAAIIWIINQSERSPPQPDRSVRPPYPWHPDNSITIFFVTC